MEKIQDIGSKARFFGAIRDGISLFSRLSIRDRMFFARRLSFLIRAGVPLFESLQVLSEQTSSRALSKILKRAINDVRNGRFLADSLTHYKEQFGEFGVNIIRVGESSGALAENLERLAEELEKKDVLRKKVISALVYPIFITVATLGVTGLLTVYIFPKITPIFNSLDVTLPLTTRILVWTSTLLRGYGLLIIGALIVLMVILIVLYKKIRVFRLFWDTLLLSLPIGGSLIKSYNMAVLCRTFGFLLTSGMSIVEALSTTGNTTRNLVYKRELVKIIEHVKAGEKISTHFRDHQRIFPSMMSHMVSIGERTGNLADTFLYLSDFYEGEVDTATKNLSNALEPALMIVMGILVGFVAVSVITPIYEITQTLSR